MSEEVELEAGDPWDNPGRNPHPTSSLATHGSIFFLVISDRRLGDEVSR